MRFDKGSITQKVLIAATAMLTASPAFAGFAQGNAVTAGDKVLFTIAAGASGFTREHRAWITQDAFDNALVLAGNRSPSAVGIVRVPGAFVVTLDGYKVATADAKSARMQGMCAEDMAKQWAQSIADFLANEKASAEYIAELTGNNPVNAQVAVVERRIYAPQGTVLPVTFATALSSEAMKCGDQVKATLQEEVNVGQFVVAAKSVLEGTVVQTPQGAMNICFNSLKTPSGTTVPVTASLVGQHHIGGPHLVVTEIMPYGSLPRYQGYLETGCRIPAQVGIGTATCGVSEKLSFCPGSNLVIPAGTPMAVVLECPQQLAAYVRTCPM